MKLRALLLLAVLATALPAAAQSDVERVRQEALKPSPLEQNLRRLTDEIGGRVPGTPAMDRALTWALEFQIRERHQSSQNTMRGNPKGFVPR